MSLQVQMMTRGTPGTYCCPHRLLDCLPHMVLLIAITNDFAAERDIPRTKNHQWKHIHDNWPGDSRKDRLQELVYFRDKRLPILKYRTTELVLLSSSISGCGHKVSVRNTAFLISSMATNNRHCTFPLGFFIETD